MAVRPPTTVALAVTLVGIAVPPRARPQASAPVVPGTTYTSEDLRRLPSGHDVVSLLETAEPSAVTDRIDGGGLFAADPARLTAAGGSWTEATWLLDGVDLTEPWKGGRPLLIPFDAALESVTVVPAGGPADLCSSAASVLLALPHPTPAWHGHASGGAVLGSSADGIPPARERLRGGSDAGLLVAGPAHGDRLGVIAAVDWRASARDDRGDPRDVHSRLQSGLADLRGRASDHDDVAGTLALQWGRRPPGPGLWSDADAFEDRRGLARATWDRRGDGGRKWTAGVDAAWRHTAGGTIRPSIERLLDGPITEGVDDRPGSASRIAARIAYRQALAAWGATHDLRLRFAIARDSASLEPFAAEVGEIVDGVAARAWDEAATGRTLAHAYDGALTVADTVAAGPVHADAGVVLDHARGRDAAAPRGIAWWSASPAASVRWSALTGDRLVLFGAASRRAHRLRLDWLQWGDPLAPSALVHRWTDANRDAVVDAGEVGSLVGRAGPGAPVGSIDPSLRRPYARDLVAGVEARLGPRLLVRLTGLDRRETGRIESVNVGLGADAYAIRLVPDPGGDLASPADDQLLPVAERRAPGDADALVLTNPDGLDARYRGLELLFDLRLGEWLRLRLGGTAHRVDGEPASRGFRAVENDPGLVGELLDTPNADTNALGRLFFDRAYAIKVSGVARAPAGFDLGWIARYQDGQPFARLVVVDDLPQGPDFVRAVANGRHRFAYTMTVDARLEKTVTRGPRRLGLSLEAFNLLQSTREVEEDVVTGPAFRTPTFVQPPRAIRFGLRLDF